MPVIRQDGMDKKSFIPDESPEWSLTIEQILNRFPIMLLSNEWTSGTNFHQQPGLEIHMTQHGEGTMVIGNRVLLQSAGSVLVFRGSVPHQMVSKSSYKRTVICVRTQDEDTDKPNGLIGLIDFTWVPADSCLSFSLTSNQFQRLQDMCGELRQELQGRPVGWERMALAIVLKITAFLQRSGTGPESVISEPAKGRKNELVQQCSDYVCGHLGDDLTLKAAARRFAVSEEYLTRTFTKEMGISFYQYVLLQRVAESKRLLRESVESSISDIAYMVGFSSASHLNRHFRALTDETPSAYRQRALGNVDNN